MCKQHADSSEFSYNADIESVRDAFEIRIGSICSLTVCKMTRSYWLGRHLWNLRFTVLLIREI